MWLAAAADPSAQDGETAIILAVIGALSLVLVAAVSGLFALLSAKANRTAPAPPPPTAAPNPDGISVIRERIAVLERRADDSDERDDVQDRRLNRIEDRLDLDDPRWTGRHDRR